jgi:hypothetical protein
MARRQKSHSFSSELVLSGSFCSDYSMNIREYPLSQKLIFAFAQIAQPQQFAKTNIHNLWISTGWQIQISQHNLQWKNVVCFSDIFHSKKWWNFESFFTPFQLYFEFFTLNWKSGENVLGFPPSFWLQIDGKQTTFFTENSAEKFEFSNQCRHKYSWYLWVLYVVKTRSFDPLLYQISGEVKENQCVYPWNENSGCAH